MALYFGFAIALGAVLLFLPVSHVDDLSFLDALFTSTSAVCVTGLIVVDTAREFTAFGKAVIAFLIQIGGLGIVTFSSWIFMLAGRKLSFRDKMLIEESFVQDRYPRVKTLVKSVLITSFSIEAFGAFLLFVFFSSRGYSFPKAFGYSLFHSISAFCNAGFSLFSNSFVDFRGSILLNVTVMFLIVSGGIGFIAIQDLYRWAVKRDTRRLSLHTKIVLSVTFFLIVLGALSIFFLEMDGYFGSFGLKDRILASLFQSVTARTAGFNTVDMAKLSLSSCLILVALMFIGASPGSCGGGIKTSTMGVLFLSVKSSILGKPGTFAFGRSIPRSNVEKAMVIFIASIMVVFVSSVVVLSWGVPLENNVFLKVIFEVVSAFGTVGLSLGITPKLTKVGKIVIILTMFTGRLGPLTLASAIRKEPERAQYMYPEEKVLVG